MFGNQWHKKEKPLLTLIGMSGGATSLSQTTSAGAGDAGSANAIHFYRLGSDDFSDDGTATGGNKRDFAMYEGSSAGVTGTAGATVGTMPPGLTSCRSMLSSIGYTANWRTSNGGFDWQSTYAYIGFFCYPVDALGNPSASDYWNVFQQKYTGRIYAVDYWMNYSGQKRFDIPNANYNSRMFEDTAFSTGPTLDTWNYVRFGKNGTDAKCEIYTWNGSSWTKAVDDDQAGWTGNAPDGSVGNGDEYIEFWATMNNRGQRGYVGNLGFYQTNDWGTDPPSS